MRFAPPFFGNLPLSSALPLSPFAATEYFFGFWGSFSSCGGKRGFCGLGKTLGISFSI